MPKDPQLDDVFFALSDGTRRRILARLAIGSAAIGELTAPLGISKPAVTRHIRILERAGLIDRRIRGRTHNCSLSTSGLRIAEDWIRRQRRVRESRADALAGC